MPISEDQLVATLKDSMPSIGAMCMRRLQTIQARFDIDDLQQVVAIKALCSRKQLESNDPETAGRWVRKIATNACRTVVAHELTAGRNITQTVEMGQPQIAYVDEQDFSEDLEQIKAALKLIPERQAQALRLRYFEMLDYAIIAERMGGNVNSVRLLVSRGLEAVRGIVR